MADVRLVDLEVFKRFSLAVRREYAPADAVLAALDESRKAVLAALDDDGAPAKARRPLRSRTPEPASPPPPEPPPEPE